MMRAWLSFVLVCGAFLGHAAPAAVAPTPIAQPTSKWVIEFEHERCTAARAYSDGKTEFAIGFEPRPTLDSLYVIVQVPKALDSLALWNAHFWMGGGKRTDTTTIATASTKPGVSRYSLEVDRKEVGLLLQNPDLRIQTDEGPNLHVQVADFAEVMKTLDECEAGLLAEWGLSREAQETLKSFPQPKAALGSYFTADDYPTKALYGSAVGIIEARVTVNTLGVPFDCHILQTSGYKDLDDATCEKFVRRVRFEPARDKSGNAVVSPYAFRARWLNFN